MSFELDFAKNFQQSEIHAFDPTPYAKGWISNAIRFSRLPAAIHYHDVALAKVDGRVTMWQYAGSEEHTAHSLQDKEVVDERTFRAARLKTLMRKLGHAHIDVLRLDIEGGEWPVLGDILQPPLHFSQLLVEFHHFETHDLNEVVYKLNKLGYKIFSVSERTKIDHHKYAQEFSFLYTKHEEQPIVPTTTARPAETVARRPPEERWSFSQREQNRDKTLRDQEAGNVGSVLIANGVLIDSEDHRSRLETVYDRRAKAQAEKDARIIEKYGGLVQMNQEERKLAQALEGNAIEKKLRRK